MPQPYRGDGHVSFAAGYMLGIPALGAPIAAISNLWTLTEDQWGVILAAMLGVQAEVGLTMYHSLTGTGSQRSVLNEMATAYLEPELHERFRELMKQTKSRAIERNAIVHGLWFYDEKTPDALILLPRNAFSQFVGKHIGAALMGRENLLSLGDPARLLSKKDWLVYKPKDFAATARRMTDFAIDLDDFFDRLIAIRGLPPMGPPARPELPLPTPPLQSGP